MATEQTTKIKPTDDSVDKIITSEGSKEDISSTEYSRIEDINNFIGTVSSAPTHSPRKFEDQFKIFDDSTNERLYYNDTENNEWNYLALTTLAKSGSSALEGAVTLTEGTGITLTQASQNIEIALTEDHPDRTRVTMTAGESISVDDAVYVGQAATTATIDEFTGFAASILLSDAAFPSTNGLRAQTITATERFIFQIDIEVEQDDLSDVTYECQIQGESGGVPDGTAISSTVTHNEDDNVDNGGARHQATATFDFSSSPVAVTPGTGYAIVIRVQSTTGNGRWAHNTSNTYTGGEGYVRSGGTWTTDFSGEYSFKVYESNGVAGRIYRCNASSSLGTTHFIGFATLALSEDESGEVETHLYNGLSGLSPGAQYFLSDTAGQISTTAGSVSKKIGRALSSTQLLIMHDNA